MDPLSKRVIAICIAVAVVMVAFAWVVNVNNLTPSKQLVCEGVFVGTSTGTYSTWRGTKGYLSFIFKLDSGDTIGFRASPYGKVSIPGERVKIYYHKGLFWKDNIYEYFAPVVSDKVHSIDEKLTVKTEGP